MATRRGFLRKIISGGAATGLAVTGLKAPEPVSEVAELKRRLAELEVDRDILERALEKPRAVTAEYLKDALGQLGWNDPNWLMQTSYPRPLEGPQPPATEMPEALRWEPGKLLHPPKDALWTSVVGTVSQYGNYASTFPDYLLDGRPFRMVRREYSVEEEIPDDD